MNGRTIVVEENGTIIICPDAGRDASGYWAAPASQLDEAPRASAEAEYMTGE